VARSVPGEGSEPCPGLPRRKIDAQIGEVGTMGDLTHLAGHDLGALIQRLSPTRGAGNEAEPISKRSATSIRVGFTRLCEGV
jgi:hypothetical protein